MDITTNIDYNIIRDTGSVTITVSGANMDQIKNIIDSIRHNTVNEVDVMRQAVLKQVRMNSGYIHSGSMKIPLIKAYRMITGQGLREAKEWVEANFSEEEMK